MKKAILGAFLLMSFSGYLFAQKRVLRPTGQVVSYSRAEYAALNRLPSPEDNSLIPVISDEDSELKPRATGRSYTVEIVNIQDRSVPNFASELNSSLMSNELINQLETDYKKQLRDYNQTYNFYINRRDTRGSRPYGLSAEEDVKMRSEMARRTRKYMLVKGIPNFLKSRPDTRDVGQAADDAMQFAEKAATFELKTKAGWSYNGGFNPLDFRLFAKASNDLWVLESSSHLRDRKTPYPWNRKNPVRLAVNRKVGTYDFGWRYGVWDKYHEVVMGHDF